MAEARISATGAAFGDATAARRRTSWSWPRRPDGWTFGTLFVAGLMAMPVIVVLGYVFVPAGDVWRHLASTVLTDYIVNSALLILGVGAGTLVIGVAAAWLVTMCQFPGRRIFEWALLLPLAIPAYVIAYTYTGLLEFAGPAQTGLRAVTGFGAGEYWFPEIRSIGGAASMMALVLYPYVYLLSRAAFLEQSICVLEASRILGRGPWRGFATVALPLARPAIVAGLALTLMETLNDFGTVQYFAVDTFTTGIYRAWLGMGEPAAAAQLAAVLMLFVFAILLLERSSRGGARFHHTSRRYRPIRRHRLARGRAAMAFAACFLPVLFGFLVPAAALSGWAMETAGDMVDSRFVAVTVNSFILAASAALLAVAIAVFLGYGLRLRANRIGTVATRIASMGYAVPGSVIAVGVLLPFAWIDNSVDSWMRVNFGISTGLVLTGTITALVFAYLVRFLAVSFNTVEASLGKVTANMDSAARVLGQRPIGVLRRIHAPIIRGSVMTAAALVFVDVMKELPATLIMRPFNFDTLAVQAYHLASDERLAEASSAALAIVAVGIIPVILLSLAISRSRPGQGRTG